MTSTYSNQVIPIEINPRDVVTTIGKIQGVNLVDNPLYMSTFSGIIQSIDTSTNTIINTITSTIVDTGVLLVSPNGNTLYVTDDVGHKLYIISLLTGITLNNISDGGESLYYEEISSDGSLLYVTNISSHTISVVSTGLQKAIKVIATTPGLADIKLNPNNTVLYVSATSNNTVSVIDTTTYKLITTISLPAQPIYMRLVNNGQKLYVAMVPDIVSCINTISNTITTTITVGNNPNQMVVSPDQKYLYVTNQGDGTISVIDTASNTIYATITTGPNTGFTRISEDGLRLYTSQYTGNIFVIDTVTNTVLTTIITPSDVAAIETSPLARFSCGQGRLTLIVDEQVGANKTFQFELTGGIINTSGTPLQNYSYIDNSNKNCSITVNVPNNIQLTTDYGSTFSFQFYPYTTINPTIHRLIRGGGVASGEVRVTVRDYVSKIIW
jgi:YVTN family beta-propeller protein